MPGRKRLLIVDDHAVVSSGIEAMLRVEEGFERIETASSAGEALEICAEFSPHVVLLDVRMPGVDGFNALELFLQRWPLLRIVLLSVSATPPEVKLAKRLGAAGYLPKTTNRATLIAAINKVAGGGTCFAADTGDSPPGILTSRELEVVRHLGRGLSNHEIGRTLGISEHTIKSHLKAIFSKLEASDRAEAVARAYELGMMSAEK
jgi:DNA-binding NarL/FixJ family response regulator